MEKKNDRYFRHTLSQNLTREELREIQNQAPSADEVPALRWQPKETTRQRQARETQDAFDRQVFRALLVGGLGKTRSTPTDGEQMLTFIYGAIRLVCLGEAIDPKSFSGFSVLPGESIAGGWQLSWGALRTGRVCQSITEALFRLLAPSNQRGEKNKALYELWESPHGLWWEYTYYYARQRSSRLTETALKGGPGLEDFSPAERESLKQLIAGVTAMHPLVEAAFCR